MMVPAEMGSERHASRFLRSSDSTCARWPRRALSRSDAAISQPRHRATNRAGRSRILGEPEVAVGPGNDAIWPTRLIRQRELLEAARWGDAANLARPPLGEPELAVPTLIGGSQRSRDGIGRLQPACSPVALAPLLRGKRARPSKRSVASAASRWSIGQACLTWLSTVNVIVTEAQPLAGGPRATCGGPLPAVTCCSSCQI
jgi:hypothetical protein